MVVVVGAVAGGVTEPVGVTTGPVVIVPVGVPGGTIGTAVVVLPVIVGNTGIGVPSSCAFSI